MEYDDRTDHNRPGGPWSNSPSAGVDDWPIFGMSISPSGGNGVNTTAEAACQIWKEEFDGMRRFGGFYTTPSIPILRAAAGGLTGCMTFWNT